MLRAFFLALVMALPAVPTLARAPQASGLQNPQRQGRAGSDDRRLADARPAVELKSQQEKTDQALAARERAATKARAAAKARDAAAATVARLKQGAPAQGRSSPPLEAALQQALARDEAAARARGAVAAADAVVAKEGARLLHLYDAVLADRRRAVDAAPASRRKEVVDAYRALVAQRDAVRKALAPVLAPQSFGNAFGGPDGHSVGDDDEVGHASRSQQGLDVGADDDVEALLEKADLARDLEARLLRKADAVHRRIAELRDEASLEGDVVASVARGQLFDEEDRRLAVTRTDLGAGRAVGLPSTSQAPREGGRAPEAPAGVGAPPEAETVSELDAPLPGALPGVLPGGGGSTGPGFSGPMPTGVLQPTATAERPLSLPTELATSTTASSLADLQAIEVQLARELAALQKKQAALKKAAADRSR